MSNNPDIYKISFGPTMNSFYLFQNDNNTGSFNFMEENDQRKFASVFRRSFLWLVDPKIIASLDNPTMRNELGISRCG